LEIQKKVHMARRSLIRKRRAYPLFQYYGNLTASSMHTLQLYYSDTPMALDSARKLRQTTMSEELSAVDTKDVGNYGQYDIQTHISGTEFTESNFTEIKDMFKHVETELGYILKSPICRMRYATIEKNDDLLYHIDQPGKDRFVMVIEGEHVIHMKSADGTVTQQLMLPSEVWYLNSNWEHKVENTGNNKRLALLGCFDYNK